jgi:hypothetical protein
MQGERGVQVASFPDTARIGAMRPEAEPASQRRRLASWKWSAMLRPPLDRRSRFRPCLPGRIDHATGSIRLASLFLTLPMRWLTGQHVISPAQGTSKAFN